MKASIIVNTLALGFLPNLALSSQPLNKPDDRSTIAAYESIALSESDLGAVSAVAGLNILDIYGAPAAGLTVETEGASETKVLEKDSAATSQYSEGENTRAFASSELKQIEEERLSANQTADTGLTIGIVSIQDNSLVSGEAQAFTTTSEINYKTRNVHHEMTPLEGDSISISRDLHIDLLKIENLRGDHFDESRSAGSIYLSDWTSRGDTTLTPR